MAKKEPFKISQKIFSTIFEQSPISTQIFSPTGETLKVNKAWEKLWGVTVKQLGNFNILKDKQLLHTEIFQYIKQGFSGKVTKVPPHKYEPRITVAASTASTRWVQNYIYPIKDDQGTIMQVVMQHEDITDSKNVEEKLRENEKRFRVLIENSADAIALVSKEGVFTYVSPSVKKILGYTPQELLGTFTKNIFPSEELKRLRGQFNLLLKTPELTIAVEHTVVHKNGSICWIENTITNHINTPEIQAYISNFRNITGRKKAEEAQALLAAIVASSEDAIISKTLGSIITSWNKKAEEMFGYSAKEAVGQHIFLIIPQEHQKEEEIIISHLRKGKPIEHFETIRMKKDGTYINVSLTISPVKDAQGNIIGASKIIRDITDKKRALEKQKFVEKLTTALTQSLDEHITLSEIAKLIVPYLADYSRIAVLDKQGSIQEIAINHENPKKVHLTKELYNNYINTPEATHGVKTILRTGKAEIIANVNDEVLQTVANNKNLITIIKKIGLKSYMGVPLIAHGNVIGAITFSSAKQYRHYTQEDLLFVQEIANRIALTLDNERLYKEATEEITYRKKIEAILQDREQRIRTIWESASDAIVVSNKKGIVIDANPAYLRLYGYSPAEVLHKNFAIIFPKNQRKFTKAYYKELFTLEKITPAFESEIVTSSGETRFVESRYSFIMNNEKREAMVSIIRDITERKELEQRKNEFISVASHELKTPVTSIKVYAQVLHKRFLQMGDTQSAGHLAKMDAQLTKLTNLIIDLLDISKIESGRLQFTPSRFFFDELVQEVTEEMQRITNKHTIIIQGKSNKEIFADKERTGQVIINFISNAIKYSPKSDKIIVHISSDATQVKLCVQDFGVGIPKEKQAKVFERFYRVTGPTQDTFPGLGLGLYISAEIIKRQYGKIWVESEGSGKDQRVSKQGSQFCFSLPIKSTV